MTRTLALVLSALFFSAPAKALPPLTQNPVVMEGFYAIGLADEIRKRCESIEPRLVRAYMYLKSLEKYARDAGYTDADIEAFVDDRDAENALRKEIRRDLRRRGASRNTPEGYCTVGREEIAKDSKAGRLLREN